MTEIEEAEKRVQDAVESVEYLGDQYVAYGLRLENAVMRRDKAISDLARLREKGERDGRGKV
jgi:hypothetical protein